MPASNDKCYLYIVQEFDFSWKKSCYIKIGISGNIDKRISQIKTSNPRWIELIGAEKFYSREKAASEEKEIHELLKDFRISGEWFDNGVLDIFKKAHYVLDTCKYLKEHSEYNLGNRPRLKQLLSVYHTKMYNCGMDIKGRKKAKIYNFPFNMFLERFEYNREHGVKQG